MLKNGTSRRQPLTPLSVTFEFTVMGFGLTNASATFYVVDESRLASVFAEIRSRFFLDDILMFSRAWKEHLDHLDAVLSALHDQSLFCNIMICGFALDSVRFLGHVLDCIRLRPDPEKIMVVRHQKEPISVTGVRQFLGFSDYFRHFV